MEPMPQALGVYVSVPFCRAKCTYCNFASGVFGPERMDAYVERLCAEIANSRIHTETLLADLPNQIDTFYFGGGTPSLLSPAQFRRIFSTLAAEFILDPEAEITLECAPGQLSPETLDELLHRRLNRISFGVQSFNDTESRAVGRAHTRDLCLAEIDRIRAAGVLNINLDLIVGLPHQTHSSWLNSVHTAIDTGVPHISIYMLEVDEDSRLGREVLAAGSRYGAATIPTEDQTAEWYAEACELLDRAGVHQYEISNFARPGFASRHNLKYWQREPYLGFGLDAHSMLFTSGTNPNQVAARFANTDNLDTYLAEAPQSSTKSPLRVLAFTSTDLSFRPEARSAAAEKPASAPATELPSAPRTTDRITPAEAFEETVFLGLRLNSGIDLNELARTFGSTLVNTMLQQLADPEQAGLIEQHNGHLRLTPHGRMVSNEVFARVLIPAEPAVL